MGFLHSYHLVLLVVVFFLGSPLVLIRPFLICKTESVISSLQFVVVLGVSYFMEFPQVQACINNNGPLIKVYLLIIFHYFRACSLGSLVIISASILCPTGCTTVITIPRIYTWVSCTNARPLGTHWSFLLCHVLIKCYAFPRETLVLLPIDMTVVSYLFLLCDLDIHCNSCLVHGISYSSYILHSLQLFLHLHPQCGRLYFGCLHSILSLVGCNLFGTDHLGCYSR
jgi:hypothetical protein